MLNVYLCKCCTLHASATILRENLTFGLCSDHARTRFGDAKKHEVFLSYACMVILAAYISVFRTDNNGEKHIKTSALRNQKCCYYYYYHESLYSSNLFSIYLTIIDPPLGVFGEIFPSRGK